MKYRHKPIVVEATKWFKNGDHPEDGNEVFADGDFKGQLHEGKVVRYCLHPYFSGDEQCWTCKNEWRRHGWIDVSECGLNVCPGDWIITGIKGEYYPIKPDIFALTYDLVS